MILNAWVADAPEVSQFIHDHLRKLGDGLVGLYAKRECPDGCTRLLRMRKEAGQEAGAETFS